MRGGEQRMIYVTNKYLILQSCSLFTTPAIKLSHKRNLSEPVISINHTTDISYVNAHKYTNTHTHRLPHKTLDNLITQELPSSHNHSCRPNTHTHTETTRLTGSPAGWD